MSLSQILASKPERRDNPALQFYLRLVGFWMAAEVDDLCLAEFAAGYGGRYGDYPGAHTKVKGGMQRFIDHMSVGLQDRIKESATVTAIEYGPKGCVVRGSMASVSGGREQITWAASHVIVTVPIGVLKAEAITFTPPLPPRKQHAIDALGAGAYKKIFLEFSEAFWGNESTGGSGGSRGGSGGSDSTSSSTEEDEPLFFGSHLEGTPLLMNCRMNGHRRPLDGSKPRCRASKGPAVLEAAVSGPAAERLIGLPDEEIVSRMLVQIRRMFGIDELPPLVGSTVTRWEEDPSFLCAYSYMAAGSSEEDVLELAAPLGGRVFFCGEATDPEYQGSAFAALLSARRALDEMGVC
jgi:monoamine oxidase